MKVMNLVQGTPEWHEFRAKHFTASDAAAMLGFSPYKTRDQLLHEKATGITEEVTPEKQRLFDRGHSSEEMARELLERESGEDFYPVTGVSDEIKTLAASFDGITMDDNIIFEHKLFSQKLADFLIENFDLPDTHWPQVEHQLIVSNAEHCIFITSDGTEEKREKLIYTSDPKRRAQVIGGWEQFAKDLGNYEVKEVKAVAVAEAIPSLPALNIELFGEVKGSNLPAFTASAKQVIESIKTDLVTDQDFADAEAIVKFLSAGEKQLAEAKKAALSKTESIESLFRAVDDLSETMRQKRLTLEKLVKAEKENKRNAILVAAKQELTGHIQKINFSFAGQAMLPEIHADFAGAMKGKKLLSSMESAVNDEVARAKIEATQWQEKISENISVYHVAVKEEYRALLFPDLKTLILKDQDDFIALVNSRVVIHEQQIREREEFARKQAEEAAQLKAEADEAARLKAEADAKAEQERLAQVQAEVETQAEQFIQQEVVETVKPNPLANIPLTTGSAIKAAKVADTTKQRNLGDALTHFAMVKGLGDQDVQELLDIVQQYTNLNLTKAA